MGHICLGTWHNSLSALDLRKILSVIKELVTISPLSMPQEKRRFLSDTQTELKVTLDSKTVEKLDKLKALLSHKHFHLKDSELMEIMAEICLEKLDPMRKIERSNFKSKPKASKNTIATTVAVSKPAQNSRYIPSYVRRAVWQSDQGQCVYIDKQTGEMCG